MNQICIGEDIGLRISEFVNNIISQIKSENKRKIIKNLALN